MPTIVSKCSLRVTGAPTGRPLVFVHGFGCDQNVWRRITPAFAADHPIVLFDLIGSGNSDLHAYDRAAYDSLDGYARDLIEVCEEIDAQGAVVVGHSVGAMIGALAAIREPERIAGLVMVGPSPRYIDDAAAGYVGGFGLDDIDALLDSIQSNFLGWSSQMAPVIMGNADRPELRSELTNSFCRTDPEIAAHFAEVTFTSDNRRDLADIPVPTLVLQCREDVIAPQSVGEYVRDQVPLSDYVLLDATGHCAHLSAPEQVVTAMREFLDLHGL